MPTEIAKVPLIIMADDDADDRLLVREAAAECAISANVVFVEDGVDLMDYLYRRGSHANRIRQSPAFILLDLNMPKKGGCEALLEIKSEPTLRHIPVVVLTTSNAERDIIRSYRLGANSYIQKPDTFEGLVDVVKTLQKYWLNTAIVPITDLEGQ
ncbi:response regulator [Capsulimonas corticalis]|uniref:Response regulator n=1 Tax=Capsulimonas corticalis TaxID=2219043 RepID=A0A402CVC3_9BACT|nr:response regulator [Capsulimonas corticalis]BDI30381.1 response regulator [Capsulimonas corticalis]